MNVISILFLNIMAYTLHTNYNVYYGVKNNDLNVFKSRRLLF